MNPRRSKVSHMKPSDKSAPKPDSDNVIAIPLITQAWIEATINHLRTAEFARQRAREEMDKMLDAYDRGARVEPGRYSIKIKKRKRSRRRSTGSGSQSPT
jgi:hypothetical protein